MPSILGQRPAASRSCLGSRATVSGLCTKGWPPASPLPPWRPDPGALWRGDMSITVKPSPCQQPLGAREDGEAALSFHKEVAQGTRRTDATGSLSQAQRGLGVKIPRRGRGLRSA